MAKRISKQKNGKNDEKIEEIYSELEEIVENGEINTVGDLFGGWSFERIDSEFGVSGRKALFCVRVALHGNGTKAAIEAGYSAKGASNTASEFIKDPKLAPVISALKAAKNNHLFDAIGATDYFVISTIVDTIKRCSQEEPVLDKMGQPTGEYKFDASNVLKGTEQLGKMRGMFVDKTEGKLDVTVDNKRPVEELTDSQLAELAANGRS